MREVKTDMGSEVHQVDPVLGHAPEFNRKMKKGS